MADRLSSCASIDDLRQAARRRAHPMVFDYIDGGSDDECALARNCDAFRDYQLLFRTLAGIETVDTSTHLLGQTMPVPFLLSPAAGNRLFHTEGERAVARVAADTGIVQTLSTLSSVSIEEVAAINPGRKWFQLYVWKDRALVREMLARARAAAFETLVLTVDFPIAGNRERDARNGFAIPPRTGVKQIVGALRHPAWTFDYLTSAPIRYANLSNATPATSLVEFVAKQLSAAFSWRDADWLLGEWNGPAVIKGIVRTDDAVRAARMGFSAVSISNHGGRQLDASPAPLDVLPEIAQALQGDAEIILDGGVRRGGDILKAIALGANAVSFARPYLYGLAAGGTAGVRQAVDIIVEGLRRDMVLLGVEKIADIDASFVRQVGTRWPAAR